MKIIQKESNLTYVHMDETPNAGIYSVKVDGRFPHHVIFANVMKGICRIVVSQQDFMSFERLKEEDLGKVLDLYGEVVIFEDAYEQPPNFIPEKAAKLLEKPRDSKL